MRKILGVLGGMGPQASASFYESIINNTKANSDQEHIDLLIYSHASIPDRTSCIDNDEVDKISTIIENDFLKLQKFGVDYIVATCNTSHYFLDSIIPKINVPVISIIDTSVEYIISKNIKKVGILATNGTINKKIYENKLIKNNIDVVLPTAKSQQSVMDIIYNQIKKNKEVDDSLFNKVIDELRDKGCEGIILGCTELSYYGELKSFDDFFINPQVILARKCIELCGGKLI